MLAVILYIISWISETLPAEIKVKLELIDANTKKRVDDNERFAVTFDGVSYTDDKARPARWWRETGVDILGANQISVALRHDSEPVLYSPASMTVSGNSDQYLSIEVKPVTYDLAFQFLNVPQYLLSSTKNVPILSFLVEYYENNEGPAQNIHVFF